LCVLSGRVRFVSEEAMYRLVIKVGYTPGLEVVGLDQLSIDAATKASTDPDTKKSHYAERRIWTVADAIKPRKWTPEQDAALRAMVPAYPHRNEDGTGGAPVPAPVPDPVPPLPVPAPTPAGRPDLHIVAQGAPVPDQSEIHYQEASMNLSSIVEPRTPEEQAALAQAVAEYHRQYADGSISPEQAVRMLDALLDRAPKEGITIKDMRQTLGRSPSWYSEQLRERIMHGDVEKLGLGRYRSTVKRRQSALATAPNAHAE
jgi:hypothetical protein